MSEAKHSSMRGGASPFRMNVLKLLKVCGFWLNAQDGAEKEKRPPLGAGALHIGERLEALRVLQVTEYGKPVPVMRLGDRNGRLTRTGCGAGTARHEKSPRQAAAEPSRIVRRSTAVLSNRHAHPFASTRARPLLVPPPDRGKPVAELRQVLRMSEAVPSRGAVDVGIELRHHVVVPQQHPIKGMRRGDQFLAVLRVDDTLDQLVHGRILDAGIVARLRSIGGGRAPEVALFIARRERLPPDQRRHIEIPAVDPVDVLRHVHQPEHRLHADVLQVLGIGQQAALCRSVVVQELDGERLARLLVDHRAVLKPVARLAEQLHPPCADWREHSSDFRPRGSRTAW